MTTFRDPPRLLDRAHDPQLREVLRVIAEDQPSATALALAAERAQRAATRHGPALHTARASKTSALKLTLLTCIGAAILYISVRATEHRVADQPATLNDAHAEAGRSSRAEPVANTAAEPTSRSKTLRDDIERVTDARPVVSEPSFAPAAAAPTSVSPTPPHRKAPPLTASTKSRARLSSPTSEHRATGASARAEPAFAASADARSPERGLASELELLESAQHALAPHPADALERVREHRRLYPKGNFAQERDVLELEVLSRLGLFRELQFRAQRFLEHNPRSPHKPRVEKLLGISR